MILEQFAATVATVSDSAQAVAVLETDTFDVVLMDMQMPVMDGLEATRRILKAEALAGGLSTPILMLSANAGRDHIEAGRLVGAHDDLTNPITSASSPHP